MLRLGITGGIGSGKSVVSKTLSVLGVPVYDCDSKAKWLQENDADVRQKIMNLLGDDVYEGQRLNRKKMAAMIFSDATLLSKVEGIVHPAVENDFNRWCMERRRGKLCRCTFCPDHIRRVWHSPMLRCLSFAPCTIG